MPQSSRKTRKIQVQMWCGEETLNMQAKIRKADTKNYQTNELKTQLFKWINKIEILAKLNKKTCISAIRLGKIIKKLICQGFNKPKSINVTFHINKYKNNHHIVF